MALGGVDLRDLLPPPGEESHEPRVSCWPCRQQGSWAGCTCPSLACCGEGWIQTLHASPASLHPCRAMLAFLGPCTHLLCPGVRAEAVLWCSLVPSPASVLGLGLRSPSDCGGGAAPEAALAIVRCHRGSARGLPAQAVRWQWLHAGSSRWHSEGGCFPECPTPVPELVGAVLTSVPGRPESFRCSQLSRASLLCSPSCLRAPGMLPRELGPL